MHERLSMIEDVIRLRLASEPDTDVEHVATEDSGRIRALEEQIALLSDRLVSLETSRQEKSEEVHVHRVGSKGEEIWIEPMRDLKIELEETPLSTTVAVAASVPDVVVAKAMAPMNTIVEEEVVVEEETEEELVEEEVVEEEVVEEEVVEEEVVEEDVVEEEVEEEEAEEEEAEEEEGVQVEVFEYKGKTYFRDDTNMVYGPSKEDTEQPDETPIGTWDPVRARILFRRI